MGKSDATGLQDYERRELAERVAYVVDAVRRRGDDALATRSSATSCRSRGSWRLGEEEIRERSSGHRGAPGGAARGAARREALRAGSARLDPRRRGPVNDGLRRGLFHVPLASAALVVPRGAERCLDSVHAERRHRPRRRCPARGRRARPPTAAAPDGARWSPRWRSAASMRSTRSPASAAVAALAFGTETIDPVDLVVGRRSPRSARPSDGSSVSAGSTCVRRPATSLVIADDSADADALARSSCAPSPPERGCRVTLIATSSALAARATSAIAERAGATTAAGSAGAAWRRDGSIRVVSSRRAACELANRYAPERLELVGRGSALLRERGHARRSSVHLGGGTALSEEPLVPGGGGMRSVRDLEALWIGRFMRQVPWHERVEPAGEASAGGPRERAPPPALRAGALRARTPARFTIRPLERTRRWSGGRRRSPPLDTVADPLIAAVDADEERIRTPKRISCSASPAPWPTSRVVNRVRISAPSTVRQ